MLHKKKIAGQPIKTYITRTTPLSCRSRQSMNAQQTLTAITVWPRRLSLSMVPVTSTFTSPLATSGYSRQETRHKNKKQPKTQQQTQRQAGGRNKRRSRALLERDMFSQMCTTSTGGVERGNHGAGMSTDVAVLTRANGFLPPAIRTSTQKWLILRREFSPSQSYTQHLVAPSILYGFHNKVGSHG